MVSLQPIRRVGAPDRSLPPQKRKFTAFFFVPQKRVKFVDVGFFPLPLQGQIRVCTQPSPDRGPASHKGLLVGKLRRDTFSAFAELLCTVFANPPNTGILLEGESHGQMGI